MMLKISTGEPLAKRKSRPHSDHAKVRHELPVGWALGATLFISAILYAHTLTFAFVYDDTSQIVQNPTIGAWSYLSQYFTQQIWGYSGVWTNLYRPLFLIYLRICDALFGLDPSGWHGFAVFMHLVNIGMAFVISRKVLRNEWMALFASVLFAVHPVQLEAVAWISGMTDVLMATPLLLGFWCYLRWHESTHAKWLGMCAIFFVLALLTKESGAMLLLLIFAYELTAKRTDKAESTNAHQFIASLILCSIVVVYFIIRWIVLGAPVGRTVAPISLSTVAVTIPEVVLQYLRMLVLPYGMSAFLPSEYVSSASFLSVILPALAILIIVVALLHWSRKTRTSMVIFASLWMFIGLLPVLNLQMLQPDDFVHIRFLYVTSIGFAWLIAIAVWQLFRSVKLRAVVIAMFVVAFGIATFAQMKYWKDNVSLYRRGVAIAPNNPVPKTNLADEYMRSGRDDEAIALLDDVLRRHPNFWTANYNRGSLAYKRQDWPATAEYMDRAINNGGLEADAYVYRGFALMKLGRVAEGEESVRMAIALRPRGLTYHFVLGLILRQEQNWPAAMTAFEEELRINPNDKNSAIHVADLKRRLSQSSPRN